MQKARHPEGIESLFKNYRMKVILKNPKSIQELQNEVILKNPVCSRIESLFKNYRMKVILKNTKFVRESKVYSK